jgi:1,6-anhydro-N-acetylmuramate kinase
VLNTVLEVFKVIGLMSGTSLDGVDAALLDTDGESEARPGAALTLPYAAWTRSLLSPRLPSRARASIFRKPRNCGSSAAADVTILS